MKWQMAERVVTLGRVLANLWHTTATDAESDSANPMGLDSERLSSMGLCLLLVDWRRREGLGTVPCQLTTGHRLCPLPSLFRGCFQRNQRPSPYIVSPNFSIFR